MATLKQANSPRGSRGGPVVIRVPLTTEQTTMVAHLTGRNVTEIKLTRGQLNALVDVGAMRCDHAS